MDVYGCPDPGDAANTRQWQDSSKTKSHPAQRISSAKAERLRSVTRLPLHHTGRAEILYMQCRGHTCLPNFARGTWTGSFAFRFGRFALQKEKIYIHIYFQIANTLI